MEPGVLPILVPLTSVVERLDLAALFPRRQPLEVELGSGDGSFLVQYAARHPERNFLGVERLLGRVRKIERKGQRLHLPNLRAVRLEAGYFVQYLLPNESVRAFHVYFPDPWPKRRHWNRRLVNARFAEQARRALAPGGALYLRTDDAHYFAQMQAVLGTGTGWQAIASPLELTGLLTDFERDFLEQGKSTLSAAFRRVA